MDYDALTIAIMRKFLQKDSNCIDVGAHTGLFIDEMLAIAPEGRHYAFEPIPDLAAELKKKYQDNVEVYGIALSDNKGISSFKYVASNPGYSGLKERRYDRPHEIVKDIKVYTDLLDNIITPDETIDFIKIDVEGAELQVLRGGYELIRRNKPVIVFEHGLGAADFYNTTPSDIFELLHDNLGLKINTLQGLMEGAESLNSKTFNDFFYSGKEWYFTAYREAI
jgi:FkbM family methyltransferase